MRQSKLLEIIQNKNSVPVSELIPLFPVSAATLRKDLSHLEEMQLVRRTHGEVHFLPKGEVVPIEYRSVQHIAAKKAIAQAAASLVQDGNSVILDSGTTTIEIAHLLSEKNGLTVITNSLPVAMAMANSNVTILMPGGLLLMENLSTQGPDAERYFRNLEVDIAFLAASGVRPQTGLTAQHPLECSVKQAIMKAARKTCAVVDASKFDESGVYLYARFEEFSAIITERRVADEALAEHSKHRRVDYLVADEL